MPFNVSSSFKQPPLPDINSLPHREPTVTLNRFFSLYSLFCLCIFCGFFSCLHNIFSGSVQLPWLKCHQLSSFLTLHSDPTLLSPETSSLLFLNPTLLSAPAGFSYPLLLPEFQEAIDTEGSFKGPAVGMWTDPVGLFLWRTWTGDHSNRESMTTRATTALPRAPPYPPALDIYSACSVLMLPSGFCSICVIGVYLLKPGPLYYCSCSSEETVFKPLGVLI